MIPVGGLCKKKNINRYTYICIYNCKVDIFGRDPPPLCAMRREVFQRINGPTGPDISC